MPANLLACRIASYGNFAAEGYAHLAAIGVRNVEIPVPDQDLIGAVRAGLAQFGLQATSLQGVCDLSRAEVAQGLHWQCEAARLLGARLLFLSVKAGSLARETAYARLRACGDVAARYGITLALETHPDLVTNGEVALETMRAVDHPHVRVNWDTANPFHYCRGIDGIAEMLKVVDYIAAVHLKETDGAYGGWYFPGFGEGRGIVDFAGVVRELNRRGFYGPFTMEIEHVAGETLTEELVRRRIAGSVEHLRKLDVI
jgi:sugar phosphate isomerase/epimerase